jgi:hypothetical protein
MENKYQSGFALSFLITSLASALLVIAKAENAALKDWMKGMLGHHWTTHGAIVILMFAILGFIFSSMNIGKEWSEKRLITLIVAGTVLGGLIIAGFTLFE